MKILFQGDSITDCVRDRNDITSLGDGYPKYVAELLCETYPDIKFEFINKGISANKTEDLLMRWREDALDIEPDIITILVGINDTWHHVDDKQWIDNKVFEDRYRRLLDMIKLNTNAKIVIMEPYALDFPDMDKLHPDIDDKIRIIRRLAREYAYSYIPLDGLFASACVTQSPSFWTFEGVHPTDEGHRLIADYCYNAICDIIDEDMMKDE